MKGYGRFYTLLKQLPCPYGEESLKRQLVDEYTEGRTTSLKDMTDAEYRAMCEGMEQLAGTKERLRKSRSTTLHLLQKLGVDTTDWAQINDFCRHPRIMGKAFAQISADEHETLQTKLRAIDRKGWHRRKVPEPAKEKSNNPVHLILMQLGTVGQS